MIDRSEETEALRSAIDRVRAVLDASLTNLVYVRDVYAALDPPEEQT